MKSLRCLVLSLLVFLLLSGCTGSETLLTNLSEDDANQVVAVLLKAGVGVQKVSVAGGSSIVVPKADLARSIDVLRLNGIPRAHHAKFEEIFPGSSFTSSPTEERARYVYLLSQSIESTLASIEGITLARVHIVLPQKATFLDPSVPATASVLLRYLPHTDLSNLVVDVQHLVANSVPGLVPEKVAVMLVENVELVSVLSTRSHPPMAISPTHPQQQPPTIETGAGNGVGANPHGDAASQQWSAGAGVSARANGPRGWIRAAGLRSSWVATAILSVVFFGGAAGLYFFLKRGTLRRPRTEKK